MARDKSRGLGGTAGGRGWWQRRAQLAKCQLESAFAMVWTKSCWVCAGKIADPQHKILSAGLAELCYKCAVHQGKSILWCQKIVGVALIIFLKNTFKVKKRIFFFF